VGRALAKHRLRIQTDRQALCHLKTRPGNVDGRDQQGGGQANCNDCGSEGDNQLLGPVDALDTNPVGLPGMLALGAGLTRRSPRMSALGQKRTLGW
jgi:hypothetical protein